MNLKALELGPVATNCYLYWDENTKDGIVIDPAEDGEKICSLIAKENIRLLYIILTHAHFDHIQAVAHVAEQTGAKIAVHEADAAGLTDAHVNLGAKWGYGAPQKPADILLVDQSELKMGDAMLKVLHTPGHTVGSICVLAGKTLFSGDTLFRGDVGRCDLPGGNFDTLKKSLRDKLMTLEDDVTVYPGHGPSTTIGYERRNNPYF